MAPTYWLSTCRLHLRSYTSQEQQRCQMWTQYIRLHCVIIQEDLASVPQSRYPNATIFRPVRLIPYMNYFWIIQRQPFRSDQSEQVVQISLIRFEEHLALGQTHSRS